MTAHSRGTSLGDWQWPMIVLAQASAASAITCMQCASLPAMSASAIFIGSVLCGMLKPPRLLSLSKSRVLHEHLGASWGRWPQHELHSSQDSGMLALN